MPIKFRCQQCRQFLGISRAQAGEIVDCPSCGRTIRVPELDGTVKPIPQPGLKLDDSRLKSALDEIASIGGDVNERLSPDDAAVDERDAERGPVTLDEPKAIELPPLEASEPVALDPLPQRMIDLGAAAEDEVLNDAEARESDSGNRPWRSTAQPRDSWKRLIAAAALKEDDESPSAAALSSSDQPGPNAWIDRDQNSESDRSESEITVPPAVAVVPADRESAFPGFSAWFAIIGLIVLICSAGFWIGRSTAIVWSVDGGSQPEFPNGQEDGASAAGSQEPGVEGRVTLKSASGQWSPDRDACVILMPINAEKFAPVSSIGLRSNDSEAERQVVAARLQSIGGAVAFADAAGRFQIAVDEPGQYLVLVLSRTVGRGDRSADDQLVQRLSQYFDRAEQLLGELACHVETIRVPADSPVPLDVGFLQPD
ncbi:MAG: hypothetical protein ACYTGL_04375 [Planctomycetota bacterium]|jgi:hypothetical protein